MNEIYYFTFIILILLNLDAWAKGGGDGPKPKKDARIIRKQLKKNLKGAEANYVFDLRGDYYNTSFLSDENTTKFNDIADIFLQETGYQVSFINVQDYLMNGTESKEDLERIRDEYIRGLEENVPDDAVYFLLIPQTDVNLEGILETQFTFNVLIGAGVDMTILDNYMKSLGLGEDEYAELIFVSLVQKILLSKKFNNASLAISATIIFFMKGDYEPEIFFLSYGTKTIRRYFQASYYYGMECNATCVMYFLQSYGLIPPDMPRRKFEYLFTSLKPNLNKDVFRDDMDLGSKKSSELIVLYNDVLFKPQTLIHDEAFLTGVPTKGISPESGYSTNGTGLYTICEKFNNYKDEYGDRRLAGFHEKYEYEEGYEELFSKKLEKIYDKLRKGLNANYFRKHVVFVGIYYGIFKL